MVSLFPPRAHAGKNLCTSGSSRPARGGGLQAQVPGARPWPRAGLQMLKAAGHRSEREMPWEAEGEDCSEKHPLGAKVMEIRSVQIVWFFCVG